MEAVHVYMKGRNGWGLFYRIEDCLVYFTLYSVLSRKMGIKVIAFNIMFNHTHAMHDDYQHSRMQLFQRRLGVMFVKDYNEEYGREGNLLKKPFGFSVKRISKKIMATIVYIFNNTVAGKMHKRAIEGRWSLLAYYNNPSPFSEKLVKRNCRHIMRESLKVVDICYKEGKYLNYATLKRILHGLDIVERNQIIDYIVSKYNFLDYERLLKYYGTFDKLLVSVDSNAGAEYELEDEYGDHSNYPKMIRLARSKGYEGVCFENISPNEVKSLSQLFYSRINPSTDQIRKFLHLPTPQKPKIV